MDIISHRGDSKLFGDNNMKSYKEAVKKGTSGLEMDVCTTSDGYLIMSHNPIDKTTGVETYNRKYSKERDLCLEEVLHFFIDYDFKYILDIKDTRVYSSICRDIYELCIKYNSLSRCIFASFNEFHLRDLSNIEQFTRKDIHIAYITSNLHEDMLSSVITKFKIKYVILYKFQVNGEIVNYCHNNGVYVYIYTCNTKGLYQYMDNIGCDGIITDVPGDFISQ